MIARWLRSIHRRMIEANIITIDKTIDSIRQMRAYDEYQERELDAERAQLAGKLQAMAQDNINLQSRDNVRALGK